MNLLIADTRKDVGRGHQSRVEALHHALGGHIVEMDDSVPCGIRLDGELICQGLQYALIRPEVVALRPLEPKPWPVKKIDGVRYPEDADDEHIDVTLMGDTSPSFVIGLTWLERLKAARYVSTQSGVVALEACCLGIPLWTWPEDDSWPQYAALMQLSHEERFEVIDGLGAFRVAGAIKLRLGTLTVFDEELDPPFRV